MNEFRKTIIFLVILISCSLILSGCSILFYNYENSNPLTSDQKDNLAHQIGLDILSRFSETRQLKFGISGDKTNDHIQSVLDFISRMFHLGAYLTPHNPEFLINIRITTRPSSANTSLLIMRSQSNVWRSDLETSFDVSITATRPPAYGSSTVSVARMTIQGGCTGDCIAFERRFIERLLYSLVNEIR